MHAGCRCASVRKLQLDDNMNVHVRYQRVIVKLRGFRERVGAVMPPHKKSSRGKYWSSQDDAQLLGSMSLGIGWRTMLPIVYTSGRVARNVEFNDGLSQSDDGSILYSQLEDFNTAGYSNMFECPLTMCSSRLLSRHQ